MFSVEWFKGKKITVMGLGVHGGGVGVAKWLRRHGAIVTATDLRDRHALAASITELERTHIQDARLASRRALRSFSAGGSLGEGRRLGARAVRRIRYVLGSHPEALFTEADMVIRNPAVPRSHALLALAKAKGVPVESDISLFFMLCPFPIAAVTGTKGKSTTTMLLAAMCRAHDSRTVIGGNIRISPLDALDRLLVMAKKKRPNPPPIVLELSSWQLESLEPRRLSPHVGILTNILEDHLNRYDGIKDYARAKELIFSFQKEGDVAVVNADEARAADIGRKRSAVSGASHGGRRLWFSMSRLPRGSDGAFVLGHDIVFREGRITLKVASVVEIRLLGKHNVANVLAATAAARSMGIPLPTIRRAIRDFHGVSGRLEEVRVFRGVGYVNDTTATAPDASIAAMTTLSRRGKKRLVLIAGGADKDLRFDDWAKTVKATVKHLVLFDGSATPKMEASLARELVDVSLAPARSMREALDEARRHAVKGDIVLLSPGCASFGVFKNEFDRGDQFVALVKKLPS